MNNNPFALILPAEEAGMQPPNPRADSIPHPLPFAGTERRSCRMGTFITQFYSGNEFNVYQYTFNIQEFGAAYLRVLRPVVASVFVIGNELRLLNLNLTDSVYVPTVHCATAYFAKGVYPIQINTGEYRFLFFQPSEETLAKLNSAETSFRRPSLLLELSWEKSEAGGVRKISAEMQNQIRGIFEKASDKIADRSVLEEGLFRLNASLIQEKLSTETASTKQEKARTLRSYILHNLSDKTLGDQQRISEDLDINARILNYEFKKLTGKTVAAFILHERLEMLRQYLSTTDLPLDVIAQKIGIPHPVSYYEQFRKKYGVSPRKYRADQRTQKSNPVME